MEIKKTIRSAPTPQINETAERSITRQRNAAGIAAVPDEFENVGPQSSLQEMTKNPTSPDRIVLSPTSAEQVELTKLLDQQRYGLLTVNLKPSQTDTKYSAAILNLAQITQKSPAELTALFNKYRLDPANLPVPPDMRVAQLFNDPAFDSTLNDLKSKIPSMYQNYKNEIANETSKANSINASNISSDTSVIDDLNTAPFKYLYNAQNGANTPEGQAWLQQRGMVGDRVSKLLSTMYPGAVINSNPAAGNWGDNANPTTLPGMIEFNGQLLNAVPDSSTGTIHFGNEGAKIDYPPVQLVPWEYDAYGAGAVSVPDWMEQANYPTHAYDNPWNQI